MLHEPLYPINGLHATRTWDRLSGNIVPVMGHTIVKGLATAISRRMKKGGGGEWTTQSLADATGIGRGTVDRASRGETDLGIDKIPLLAKAYGMKSWELIKEAENGDAPPRSDPNAPTIKDVGELTPDQRAFLRTVSTLLGKIPDRTVRAMNAMMLAQVPPPDDEPPKKQAATAKPRREN